MCTAAPPAPPPRCARCRAGSSVPAAQWHHRVEARHPLYRRQQIGQVVSGQAGGDLGAEAAGERRFVDYDARPVFCTEAAMVGMSSGFRVATSITSAW